MKYVSDVQLLQAFFRALPPETQLQTARRIDVSDSQVSRWLQAIRSGDSVSLHTTTRKNIERALADLTRTDPVLVARHEAIQMAVDRVEQALDELRRLLPPAKRSRRK